jgi:hypothetical protein
MDRPQTVWQVGPASFEDGYGFIPLGSDIIPIRMRVTAFLLLTAMCPAVLAMASHSANQKPAINVVISFDTLPADHVGCYGYKQIRTPSIDSLAAAGVRFERAYTPLPITLPAHTVVFAGTYPTFNGMHDFSASRLSAKQPSLACLLKAKGYATAAVVASAVLDSRFGLNGGFDFYYDHFECNRLHEADLDEMERPGNIVADVARRSQFLPTTWRCTSRSEKSSSIRGKWMMRSPSCAKQLLSPHASLGFTSRSRKPSKQRA